MTKLESLQRQYAKKPRAYLLKQIQSAKKLVPRYVYKTNENLFMSNRIKGIPAIRKIVAGKRTFVPNPSYQKINNSEKKQEV